ncbi:hypothetical protein AB0D32_18230 [Micromonospora sp. NPDC048170]|uniref:hypothetical protein n=1 Tax=Micromonospora sp. NPDC048170 TaxID=3154819 RepID=UPI0033F58CDB
MAKHRASGDDPSTRKGVTERPDTAYWSVDDSPWQTVRPDLPDHMVDLLAPPIVVGVARVPVTCRLTPPPDLRPTAPPDARPTAPADVRPTAPADPRPALDDPRSVVPAGYRRTVPAGPGSPGRRPAGATAPGGRHRQAAGRPDRTS